MEEPLYIYKSGRGEGRQTLFITVNKMSVPVSNISCKASSVLGNKRDYQNSTFMSSEVHFCVQWSRNLTPYRPRQGVYIFLEWFMTELHYI